MDHGLRSLHPHRPLGSILGQLVSLTTVLMLALLASDPPDHTTLQRLPWLIAVVMLIVAAPGLRSWLRWKARVWRP